MNEQNEGIAILLANRCFLYKLLQRIFGDEPNAELMEIALSQHTQEALQLLLNEDEQQFDTYFELLTQLRQALEDDAEITLDKLKDEYTYLLIGPNKLPAPPWESVYLTKERTIFQESTLNVRRIYLGYNFLPANYPHEADDHLALELDFMAHLAELTQGCFEEEKTEEIKKLLLDQKAFLDEHLLVWIGDFAKQIQQGKTQYFYPQIAELMEQVLIIDAAVLDEILSLM
ncbi:MAG: cytoplasmic chaperone TorD family protein [Firmicutes bacterium]|nr:cytoplasmic chaperone TorD family protein [Bacillota bacterium]